MIHGKSERECESARERRLLLGIDPSLTAATRHALHTAGEFFAPSAAQTHFLLLNVVPIPIVTGRYGYPHLLAPTTGQRILAEEALRIASAILQHHGIQRSHIETLILAGTPADELVRVARQQQIDCLIIGNHESTARQRFWRMFMGSISCDVFRFASCPVLLATLPRSQSQTRIVETSERAASNLALARLTCSKWLCQRGMDEKRHDYQ